MLAAEDAIADPATVLVGLEAEREDEARPFHLAAVCSWPVVSTREVVPRIVLAVQLGVLVMVEVLENDGLATRRCCTAAMPGLVRPAHTSARTHNTATGRYRKRCKEDRAYE